MIQTVANLVSAQLAKECEPLNRLEAKLTEFPPVSCPVKHCFTPGLYSREIFMPASAPPVFTIITTQIHKTEHQYIVSTGKLDVWTEGRGWVRIVAPFHGITKAGTRRALRIIEDTIWTTFHPTDKTTVPEVMEELIEAHGPEQAELLRKWNEKWGVDQFREVAQ